MIWCPGSFTLLLYFCVVNLFGLFLRYVALEDYFLCYACIEMDSLDKQYDYIVVGSGSAGSIVAQRLAQSENTSVLLLDAGTYGNSLMDIPSFGIMLQNTVFDWQYRTTEQRKSCLGLKNHVSFWPMGKIIGGTSKLNNMVYVRGHVSDFDRWYRLKSDYSYERDILPYFTRLEDYLGLSELIFKSGLSDAIGDGLRSLGYQESHENTCTGIKNNS